MELELNSLDWNENELEHEHELELEDMERTHFMFHLNMKKEKKDFLENECVISSQSGVIFLSEYEPN